jgi:hypothetical protein
MAKTSKLRVLTLSVINLLLITSIAFAQVEDEDTRIKDRSEDIFREMKTGELTLRFINALNGDYVTGATVVIDGQEYTTDYEGRAIFKTDVENGQIPVFFQKEGFISADFDLEIMLGTIFQNRISVSPDMRPESIRIVLDWGDRPRDLDAHLIKENGYHISYRDKRTSDDGMAKLDRDDTNRNGPETITVNEVNERDVYTYKVHNFSDRRDDNSQSLANESKAVVRIYGDNRLMGLFRIDKNQTGTEWTVFQIQNRQIIAVEEVE